MKPVLNKHNNLRNQILFVFLFAMVIVLLIVGILTYNLASNLITNNAKKQLTQTALEASGRMESLYEQINLLSKQVITDSYVQQLLVDHENGQEPEFRERQILMQRINILQAYSSGITSFELYSRDYERLIPLGEGELGNRLKKEWILKADQEKGRMVWIGRDPKEPGHFLAIRRVSLIDRTFSNGGYLLIQVTPNYFQLMDKSAVKTDYTVLADQNNEVITSNYPGDVKKLLSKNEQFLTINENDYMLVRQKSSTTGWTIVIIKPVSTLMDGVSVLRTATFLSGMIGFILFVIISYFLSTMITKPIFRLTQTMKKGSRGRLAFNPESSSTYEIIELNSTYNQMVEEINHLIQVVYEKELIRSKTELKALQSQINPHFLFNTLNALYWSLEESGEEELAEYVIAMSDLFRYTIEDDEWVTIKQELEHIEKYMQLMTLRIGDRFRWEIDVPDEFMEQKIPKLLIQPLVENALIHGIGNKAGDGKVSVCVEKARNGRNIQVQVADNGKGMGTETLNKVIESMEKGKVSSTKGNGIAIANVNKRLQLYYPDQATGNVSIKSELNKGTCCTFELPIMGGNNHVWKEHFTS